jgi:hypothetical protein
VEHLIEYGNESVQMMNQRKTGAPTETANPKEYHSTNFYLDNYPAVVPWKLIGQ